MISNKHIKCRVRILLFLFSLVYSCGLSARTSARILVSPLVTMKQSLTKEILLVPSNSGDVDLLTQGFSQINNFCKKEDISSCDDFVFFLKRSTQYPWDYFMKVLEAKYGCDNASQEFQGLAAEVQDELGFSQANCIIVRSLVEDGFLAVCYPGGVVINEEILGKAAYGVKRKVFFHEFFHKKYRDDLFGQFFMYFQKKCICSWPFVQKLSFYIEQRADRSAYKASKCYRCVEDCYNFFQNYKLRVSKGYLLQDEIMQFRDQFKRENKLCKYHRLHDAGSIGIA